MEPDEATASKVQPRGPVRPDHAISTEQHEFHMEEYRQIRAECMSTLARIETLFRYSLIVLATVFSWLMVNSLGVVDELLNVPCLKLPRFLLLFAWMLPPLFIGFAGHMARLTHMRVQDMGGYLDHLENLMGVPTYGWEKHLLRLDQALSPQTARAWWGVFILSLIVSGVGVMVTLAATTACPVK
jgi:hypothetical protein